MGFWKQKTLSVCVCVCLDFPLFEGLSPVRIGLELMNITDRSGVESGDSLAGRLAVPLRAIQLVVIGTPPTLTMNISRI